MKRAAFLAAAVVLGLASRAPAATPGAGAAEKEIEAGSQPYAGLIRTMDADGLAALYADDGELLNPGMETLKGREAIRKFLLSPKGAKVDSSTMTTDALDVTGDAAVQWGTYVQRVAPPGQSMEEFRGRYVAQWARQADGRWLLKRMLAQRGPPPQGGR